MGKQIFITGIGTDVGKTVASAIVVEALQADYFKPVQAGDLEFSDTDRVRSWINNTESKFYPNAYALHTPMSPHAAAAIDKVTVVTEKIKLPETTKDLVIEGAGGILVPLNDTETILDIIKPSYKVIVVSRHYLGSINHSLLTIKALQEKGCEVSILFNGEEHPTTEEIIVKMTGAKVIGRINEETQITKEVIKHYAERLKENLVSL